MSRWMTVGGAFALAWVLVLGRADSAPVAKTEVAKPTQRKEPLGVLLTGQVKFSGIDAPGAKLSEALEMLSKAYGLDFEINDQAFKAEQFKDVGETLIAEKPLRKHESIRLDRLLRLVLERIPVPGGATFVVRGNSIEITTNGTLRPQIWGNSPGPFLPLVNRSFDKQPLVDALKALAEQAEYNVVLDNRVGDKAKTPVTARFANAPLDTAVGFLADMADLRPVLLDNVVYVTTKDNAALWEARLKKNTDSMGDVGAPAGPRIGSGVGNTVPMRPPPGAGM